MSKYLNKTVAFLLVLVFIISNCIIASAETSYTKGYITIYNISNNERISYEAIDVNGELFVSSDDVAKIINMEATTCEESVFYSNYYANRSIDVCFDGSIWTRGITYKATVHNVDETYYFPLEKMLYLANAQWCVENNIVYVQSTDNTILDFIDAYCMEILDNNITQTELLMNGESELSNAAKSSFAAIFNDFDVRVFVPIWGAITLTVEDYQNAMLQLAKDELEFIDEYGQKNLDDLLDKSSFSEIKSIWDDAQSVADLPENILTAVDYVNQTYLWIKDTKNGTKMFSEYNNLADFTPAEIGAISKELQGVSDILTIANAIVNVNEIATRSKSWNEDFLAQIELLTDFDETGYNKSMVNYIKKASTSLLEEHADTFSATTDACVEETLKVLGEKLVDLTPAGTLTSIITTGLSVAKLFDEDFAASFDALELSNMVEWLIRIEHVAFTEMSRDIVTMRMKSLNGGSTLEELTELRNTTMLALRTNLRNKVFIYYLNTVRNKDSSWANSDEAKEIEQDILWNYAKIIELSESEPYDRLLILDSFDNMYSNEYGCKRDKINSDILSETNAVTSPEEAYRIWENFLISGEYKKHLSDALNTDELEYVIFDVNADDVPEMLIQSTSDRPFFTTWLFVLQGESVKLVSEQYGYGQYRYSLSQDAVIGSPEWKPFDGTGYSPFYRLNETCFEVAFEITQDLGVWYYIDENNKIEISEEERTSYFTDILWFEWLPIESMVSAQSGLWKDIPDNFTFTSGAGAWATGITIEDDGTFTGEYHDSDMGDTGSQYPNGVVYICNFRGKFSAPEQINNYIYTMKLENLTIEKTPGEVYYENGIKYICSDPYGFDNADEFLIYLPGCPLEETSEEFLSWSFINTQIRDTIPTGIYGIYNVGGMAGFMGKDENSLWGKTYAYSYNSYRSELQPSYYSESHLNFWPESGAATLVLGFDWSNDNQTEFIATDYRGTGEYSISLDFNEDFSSVKVTLKSLSGFNLEPWGGSANGTLSVEYKMK